MTSTPCRLGHCHPPMIRITILGSRMACTGRQRGKGGVGGRAFSSSRGRLEHDVLARGDDFSMYDYAGRASSYQNGLREVWQHTEAHSSTAAFCERVLKSKRVRAPWKAPSRARPTRLIL
jgi:hypothetical protein